MYSRSLAEFTGTVELKYNPDIIDGKHFYDIDFTLP